MNSIDFEKVKNTAEKLAVHQYVKLQPDFDEKLIKQFVQFMHPNCELQCEPGRCSVKAGANIYTYTLYVTGIIRAEFNTSKRVFYSFRNF